MWWTLINPRLVLIIITIVSSVTYANSTVTTVTADWGDIVNVRYSLYLDAAHTVPVEGNIDQVIHYIYLSRGGTIPGTILQLYPEASTSFLEGFKAGIVGMEVKQTKEIRIDAKDAYPSSSHPLYGEDLYFFVELLEILYDASYQMTSTVTISKTTTTSLHSNTTTLSTTDHITDSSGAPSLTSMPGRLFVISILASLIVLRKKKRI